MGLADTALSEISRPQKDTDCMSPPTGDLAPSSQRREVEGECRGWVGVGRVSGGQSLSVGSRAVLRLGGGGWLGHRANTLRVLDPHADG